MRVIKIGDYTVKVKGVLSSDSDDLSVSIFYGATLVTGYFEQSVKGDINLYSNAIKAIERFEKIRTQRTLEPSEIVFNLMNDVKGYEDNIRELLERAIADDNDLQKSWSNHFRGL